MKKIFSLYARPLSPAFVCRKPSLTQQHFKEDCDVNVILQRYLRTGSWTGSPGAVPTRVPNFTEFDQNFDYQAAHNMLIDAQRRFMALPVAIRERFHNNPAELLDFVSDVSNRDEAAKLGIIDPIPDKVAEELPNIGHITTPIEEVKKEV